MRDILKLGTKLLIIAAVAGLALGVVNEITKEPIAQQTVAAQNAARTQVLPAAVSFEQAEHLGEVIYVGSDATGEVVGYCATGVTKGYGGDMEITVGIDLDGKISGVNVGGSSFAETAGLGAKAKDKDFTDRFIGLEGNIAITKDGGQVESITSASKTSRAVANEVNRLRLLLLDCMKGGN